MLSEITTNIIGKRYELQSTIGRGGMGAVYQAYDRLTGESVALKRVYEDGANLPDLNTSGGGRDFRLMLAQEFKLLATMHHPYIIKVQDYGFDSAGVPYFTMELLADAVNLLEACQQADQPTIVRYFVQILQALEYLHRRGVLHRDLKPANVLVMQGEVRVLDFGLSKMLDRAKEESGEDTATAGTIAYMAPEILMGHRATVASDLYATGVMFYEALAGVFPFDDNNITTLINQVIYEMPDLSRLESADLKLVVERLLQKDPDSRYADAREAFQALEWSAQLPTELNTTGVRESLIKSARLVGRDSEIGQLTDAFNTTLKGRGNVTLIAGESGVGKSRLIDEIRTLTLVQGALVMRGSGVGEGGTPYQIWRTVFRWLALLVDDMTPLEAGLIKLLVPDVITVPDYDLNAAEELESQKVQSHLLQLLERGLLNQDRPIMIMLEDLHWAGSESLSLLSHLVGAVANLPVMVIASYRDDERPDLPKTLPALPVIKLDRLDEQDIAELSRAMLGDAGTHPQVIDLLNRETEGNVFFLVEVVRALAEEVGDLDQIGRMTLPQSVFAGGIKKIIQRRLNHVPESMRRPLQLAAVSGRELNLQLLAAISPETNIDTFLTVCANAAVLESRDGTWQFTHDKLRGGVLEQLSPVARRELHHRVAQGIEAQSGTEAFAAALAYHWGQAGDREREEHYVAIAGEQALRSGAYQQAIDFFERALQLMHPEALSTEESQIHRVYLQHRKAEAYLGFGGYTQARQLYHESLIISEQIGDLNGMAEALFGLGNVDYARAIFESAEVSFQRSLETFRQLEDRAGEARALNNLGNVAYELGDDERARTLYQQSLSIMRETGGQWGMAGSLSTDDQPKDVEASQLQQQRRDLIEQLTDHISNDDQPGMADTFYELAVIGQRLREWDDARQNFRKALGIYRDLGDHQKALKTQSHLGRVLLAAHKLDEAEPTLKTAFQLAIQHEAVDTALIILVDLADLKIQQTDYAQALQWLAFIMTAEALTLDVEDRAERLIFTIEDSVPDAALDQHWEAGKTLTWDAVIAQVT
jgi:eukaryotic-like serine/threonine-protein kinase